jgi:NAD(P)-dependent dehydrogenase (short-subunit alcohol dehydrogenase family)
MLVTGCSSGFGEAAALYCARAGERVFATVRDLDHGSGLLATAAAEGLALELVELELTDGVSCDRAVATVLERAGRLDALVNNAGRVLYAAIEETAEDEVAGLFDVNVHGPLRMIRAALPAMRAQGSGSIVNVSSVNAIVNLPFSGIYGATKWALEGMSQALWLEVAPFGIRVAVVEPAGFGTAIADKAVATALPHEGSPYWEGTLRARAASRAANEASPDLTPVAEAVHAAAFGEDRRFRWPVGTHADMLGALTRTLDDVELLDALSTGFRAAFEHLSREP